MGSSSQKTTSTSAPWGPTQGMLRDDALPRIEQSYQTAQAGGDPLAAAKGYTSNVLGGQYLDPSTNPHLGALTKSITDPIQASLSAQFSRAGRGTSGDAARYISQGMTSGLAAPLFQQYNTERGLQSQAATQSGMLADMGDVNLNQYLKQLGGVAGLGGQSSGTSTASPSGAQTAASVAMLALMMMSDRRAKTDIKKLAGTGLRGMNVYGYRYKQDEPGTRRVGLMAQEVEKVIPEAVATRGDGYKMVDYAAVDRAVAGRGMSAAFA